MQNETKAHPLPNIQEFFAPGGVLASSVPFKLEDRPGQLKMALGVGQAITNQEHLVVEAGTGTGKTMAYLYPALRHALVAKQRVIVSTGTKHLQEQIFYKDIPMLQKAIGDFKVCYLKGRANYLCIDKFNHVRPAALPPDELREFNIIDKWRTKTESGDRAELSSLPDSSSLWKRINARGDVCTGRKCSRYEDCFVSLARQDADAADIVIVNHHLFFSDLVVRMKNPKASILPDAEVVIFDEAHELETVASESFGVSVSNRRIADISGDIQCTLIGFCESQGLIKLLDELGKRFSDLCLMVPIENKAEHMRAAAAFLQALIEAVPYRIHTVLTDNGIQFADLPKNREGPTARFRGHPFDRLCLVHGIEHRLTRPNHPWTNGQVERMNRTIKDATVKRYFYDTHKPTQSALDRLPQSLQLARRLKTLKGLTPYEYLCKLWTQTPDRFTLNPIHQKPGLNS